MGEARRFAGRAFISYVREDAAHVDQLQQALEAAGIRVWRDTADLWPGQNWRAEIRRAITDNALVFIACFSRKGLEREQSYQREELVLAIEHLRLLSPNMSWLIPVRFDDCPIPDYDIGGGRMLADLQTADLFGDRSADNTQRLVAALLRILGRRSGDEEVPLSPAPAAAGDKTCRGWIDSPIDGDIVGTRFPVRGGARNLPDRHHLWITHRIDPGGLLWPKDPEIRLDHNGHFDVYVYEGAPSPRLYVALLIVTAELSADFDRWIAEGSRTGHYPGLRPPTDSCVELASVSLRHETSVAEHEAPRDRMREYRPEIPPGMGIGGDVVV